MSVFVSVNVEQQRETSPWLQSNGACLHACVTCMFINMQCPIQMNKFHVYALILCPDGSVVFFKSQATQEEHSLVACN